MPLAQRHRHQILRISANTLDLTEGGAGTDEGERAAFQLFQLLPAESQTEAVHGHHAEAHIRDLKERTGMDRAAFIGRDGKGHLLDHAPQHLLLHRNGIFILNLRQIRIIRGGQAQNVKIRIAAGDMDHHFFISGKGDHIIGHPADDIAEQSGVQYDVAAFHNVGENVGTNTGLHVVAGDGQLLVRVDQQTFQRRNGALLGNGPAGDGNRVLEENFFTGKFNHESRFLSVSNRDKSAF